MAVTWICEKCGKPNLGDLCQGCGEYRPIRILSAYGSDHQRIVIDRMSEPKSVPIPPSSVLMLIGFSTLFVSQLATLTFTFWFGFLLLIGYTSWRWGIGKQLRIIKARFWQMVANRKSQK